MILFFSLRDFAGISPTVTAINHLSKTQNVSVVSYYGTERQFNSSVFTLYCSLLPYPKSQVLRKTAKVKFILFLFKYVLKNRHSLDIVWASATDIPFVNHWLKLIGFKGKLVFQMHELNFKQFRYLPLYDYVIIPEENRLWITYFLSDVRIKPYLIPNIPQKSELIRNHKIERLEELRKEYPTEVFALYQGTIDIEKRCLEEVIVAFSMLPENFKLIFMPGNYTNPGELEKLNDLIKSNEITGKVFFIDSEVAPLHLSAMKYIDVGIGLYKASSLNQVYAAPNRLYEFAMFNRPQILPDFPAFRGLSVKYGHSFTVVDPENIKEICRALLKYENQGIKRDAFELSRDFFNDYGDYEMYFNNFWRQVQKDLESHKCEKF